ncbi:predicted protein [Aspergillus nidulans FGSC A4]|uniref:Uncharacterized protein n=1 Tax=Emericella nidulans (strain FGSC A4 / ATCC 38163 / CBS 112.46 / NRRL 194 / M139) TaxID=227321 RepID=Q5BFZ0_EMENI|nr:hypothetical protein [Aspergillus nidulans FGSC A4]EAA66639.1 predicted protein [Aspergillus nidulans FGSC A4]CBF89278.1 TPA: conserved hypothetical protein [Aspergillus nidulans FGSC A4]|eukprot:XP_658144.1 predicted protein [Aspergillus nidulans FGSC A4]
MASEDDLNGLDLPEFGSLPFDLYVMEFLGTIPLPEEIPSNVPQNLLTPKERAHDGQIERTFFIRTWYGDPSDPASQQKADDDYAHLVEVISSDYGDMGLMMDKFFIFDEKEEFSSSLLSTQSRDVEFSDDVAIPRPGCMPSYVLAALMHCPDQIEGNRVENLHDLPPAEEAERRQMLLVLVADRKACEEGWVLHLAINHKGQVLPFRIRNGADWVSASYGNWCDGQQLTENTQDPEADVEMYMDHGAGGGGWD